MPPPQEDTSRVMGFSKPFRVEASSVVVAFRAAGGQDHDHNHESDRKVLRMSFKACYEPPIITFRFSVSVFGYSNGKKVKTTLYFDVPRKHISSLDRTNHVDLASVPELNQDNIPKLVGGITRIRFLLTRPGNLVQPTEERSLKAASQRTLLSMTLLATALEFDLFLPHTTLSKEQIQCLQQAITLPMDDQQGKQEKEHDWWLKALYGGAGGKLLNTHTTPASPTPIYKSDTSTASESGDSTIATATPPAYKKSTVPSDRDSPVTGSSLPATAFDLGDEVATANPPPYESLDREEGDPASAAEMTGKQLGKRLRESVEFDSRCPRRRFGSEPRPGDCEKSSFREMVEVLKCEKPHDGDFTLPYPIAMIFSKLNEALIRTQDLEKENSCLKAELSAMRNSQHQISAKLAEIIEQNHNHMNRTQDLENGSTYLETQMTNLRHCYDDIGVRQTELEERQTELEEAQAELNVRQEKTEGKCETIEVEIIDQVHTALKNRLIDALETM